MVFLWLVLFLHFLHFSFSETDPRLLLLLLLLLLHQVLQCCLSCPVSSSSALSLSHVLPLACNQLSRKKQPWQGSLRLLSTLEQASSKNKGSPRPGPGRIIRYQGACPVPLLVEFLPACLPAYLSIYLSINHTNLGRNLGQLSSMAEGWLRRREGISKQTPDERKIKKRNQRKLKIKKK